MDEQRRRICQFAGIAVLGSMLPASAGCSSDGTMLPAGQFNAGSPSQVAMDDVLELQFTDQALKICRDDKGLYAMSGYCTHAHCIVQFETQDMGAAQLGFVCNCHGSEFDYNGKVLNPPAPSALPHFALSIDGGGSMIVDTNTVVDPSTRTMG